MLDGETIDGYVRDGDVLDGGAFTVTCLTVTFPPPIECSHGGVLWGLGETDQENVRRQEAGGWRSFF